MLERAIMHHCNSAIAALLLAAAGLSLTAQNPPNPSPTQAPPLTVDRDPVRSPDGSSAGPSVNEVRKEGGGYVLRQDVEEVILNATVLDGNRLVQDLKKENFTVFEDGVRQNIISFQHTDLPVSIALVVDNSGSMSKKRPAVNQSTLDLIQASNPQDEAFVVNFSTRRLSTRNLPRT